MANPVNNNAPVVQQPINPNAPVVQQPVAQQPAPAVTTAETAVQIAQRKLSESNTSNLWKDTSFANASIAGKVVAVLTGSLSLWIQYAIGYSAAAEKDKTDGATIKEYNEKLVALVHHVGQRGLTSEEAGTAGVAGLTFNRDLHQQDSAERMLAARAAEKDFFEVFQKRVTQLNVNKNSDDYGIYSNAAVKAFEDYSKSDYVTQQLKYPKLMPIKISTAANNFSTKIFEDMVEVFADQPAVSITKETYADKVKAMKKFFPKNEVSVIETALRSKLREKHSEAFTKLATEYRGTKHIATINKELADKFKKEQETIEADLKTLRGDTGFNGTVNAADKKLKDAAEALNKARTEFYSKYKDAVGGANYGLFNGTAADDDLSNLDLTALVKPEVATALADFKTKRQVFAVAKKEFDDISEKLGKLAQWNDQGAVIGGEYAEVQAKRAPQRFSQLVREESDKNAAFYASMLGVNLADLANSG